MVNLNMGRPDHEGPLEGSDSIQLKANNLPLHNMEAPVRHHRGMLECLELYNINRTLRTFIKKNRTVENNSRGQFKANCSSASCTKEIPCPRYCSEWAWIPSVSSSQRLDMDTGSEVAPSATSSAWVTSSCAPGMTPILIISHNPGN